MSSLRVLALCVLLVAGTEARAEETTPFAALLGCWRGVFEGAPDIADERCFEPMLGGVSVRDTHAVRPTSYHGETIHYRDAHTGGWAFTYYASNGGVSRGVTQQVEGALVFPAHIFLAVDGAEQRLRSIWRIEGADRFVVTSEREEGGVWRPFGVITYTRVAQQRGTRSKEKGPALGRALRLYSNPNQNQFEAPVTMTPETTRSSLLGSPNTEP